MTVVAKDKDLSVQRKEALKQKQARTVTFDKEDSQTEEQAPLNEDENEKQKYSIFCTAETQKQF